MFILISIYLRIQGTSIRKNVSNKSDYHRHIEQIQL